MKLRIFGGRVIFVGALFAAIGANLFAQITVTVDVTGVSLAFSPADVTIDPGDTVMWTGLQSGLLHNVVEVAQAAYDANQNVPLGGGFSSGLQGAVATFSRVFNTPGTFYYICQPHIISSMKGTVTVLTPPTPTPIPTLTQWGLIAMGLLIVGIGAGVVMRRRRYSSV